MKNLRSRASMLHVYLQVDPTLQSDEPNTEFEDISPLYPKHLAH